MRGLESSETVFCRISRIQTLVVLTLSTVGKDRIEDLGVTFVLVLCLSCSLVPWGPESRQKPMGAWHGNNRARMRQSACPQPSRAGLLGAGLVCGWSPDKAGGSLRTLQSAAANTKAAGGDLC